MANLQTQFTNSGITTTTPTPGSGGYGDGGYEYALSMGLDPALAKLIGTKIASAQVAANMQKEAADQAYTKSIQPKRIGMGRNDVPSMAPRDDARAQQRREDETAQAKQAMLARQAQTDQQLAQETALRKSQPYRFGGMLIDPKLGFDQSVYMQTHGVGKGIYGQSADDK